MQRRKLGKSEQYSRIDSEYSRIENSKRAPNNSLIFGAERSINTSGKRYRKLGDSEERRKLAPKTETISHSMTRMMRASPKIHLKHHIHNTMSKSSHRKDQRPPGGRPTKLVMHQAALEPSLPSDTSRNQKIDSILQKHVLKPVRTTSASRPGGSYNKSSVIGRSLHEI